MTDINRALDTAADALTGGGAKTRLTGAALATYEKLQGLRVQLAKVDAQGTWVQRAWRPFGCMGLAAVFLSGSAAYLALDFWLQAQAVLRGLEYSGLNNDYLMYLGGLFGALFVGRGLEKVFRLSRLGQAGEMGSAKAERYRAQTQEKYPNA